MEVTKSLSTTFSDQSWWHSQILLQSLCISSLYLSFNVYVGICIKKEENCAKVAISFAVIHTEAHHFLYWSGMGWIKPHYS